MKVVLAVDALTPPLSGIGRYTWELSRRLPAHPAINTLFFYRNGYWVKEPESLLMPLASGEIPAYKRNAGLMGSSKWLRYVNAKWQCRNAVFHGPNYFLPPCTDTGVITVHDLSIFKFPELHPADRLRQFEIHFSNSIDRASHVITDSESIRQEVIDFLGWPDDRVTAVPLGVSDQFRPYPAESLISVMRRYGLEAGRYSLCVSTLDPRKRIDRLVDAYELLPADVRMRFPLILIGPSGWLNDDLHLKIAEAMHAGWLNYLGYVPEDDLPFLFAGARLFVYPSIYEGFGLPVAEAMASGVPVITSKFSCLPEVTRGAAIHVDPDDMDAFKEAIYQGLDDEQWRESTTSIGLKVSEHYRWPRCISDTIAVYHKLHNG